MRLEISKRFLSTPSARRATGLVGRLDDVHAISIHALREEGDFSLSGVTFVHFDFYPRPPRGGRLGLLGCLVVFHQISIHALREEGDAFRVAGQCLLDGISIHALREEGDVADAVKEFNIRAFLSTPSARRATLDCP